MRQATNELNAIVRVLFNELHDALLALCAERYQSFDEVAEDDALSNTSICTHVEVCFSGDLEVPKQGGNKFFQFHNKGFCMYNNKPRSMLH